MKIGRFEEHGKPVYGVTDGDAVWAAGGSIFEHPEKGRLIGHISELKALVPCEPTKILAIGRNYRRPDIEFQVEAPQVFLKPLTTLAGDGDPIIYPWMSERVIYEPELAVVIGKRTKNVPVDQVLDHVLGYTCANDVTAKDLNLADRLGAGRAKIFDTFCPLGPVIATGIDGNDLAICGRINDQPGPSSRTSQMIHRVEEVVSFISCATTLLPGDIILLATPGTGEVHPGDVVEVEIEGIGVLRNQVVASDCEPIRWQIP
jgi:2-keto-4-pentenoate hydratase/2-oxohepta-3-ene-1,7-dioic acid hydratase in catechol pathway